MKNAVIYARYSSDRQNEMSITGQIAECRKFAEEHDLIILQEYIDRALTATSDKRPSFLRMIDDSNDGYFDTILVYQLDRFARNKNDSGYYKKILADNGVKVVSAKEHISEDSSGVITEGLIEVFAEYFSRQLSEKVTRGMYLRAEQCKYNGGTMTFGYAVDPEGYYILDEIKAPIVKEMFERIAQGETAISICRDLNERGIRSTKGNVFTKNSLQNILRNERYKGIYIFGHERIPDGIPRIIDDDLFDEVQEQLGKKVVSRRPAIEDYILTGKLFCGYCKEAIIGTSGTSQTGRSYRYYMCKNAPDKCNKKNVKKEYIEKTVLKICFQSLTDNIIDEVVQKTIEQNERNQESPELIRLRSELKNTQNKIEKLVTEIENGTSSSTIANRLAKREDELESIKKQLQKETLKQKHLDPADVRSFLRLLRRGRTDNITYQKMLIHIFVDRIYLYDDHLVIYLKGTDKRITISDHEAGIVEESLTDKGSENEECGPPTKECSFNRILHSYFLFLQTVLIKQKIQ